MPLNPLLSCLHQLQDGRIMCNHFAPISPSGHVTAFDLARKVTDHIQKASEPGFWGRSDPTGSISNSPSMNDIGKFGHMFFNVCFWLGRLVNARFFLFFPPWNGRKNAQIIWFFTGFVHVRPLPRKNAGIIWKFTLTIGTPAQVHPRSTASMSAKW